MSRPLLIDTHAFYWMAGEAGRLKPEALRAIRTAPTVYLSVVSAVELSIKHALGKLPLPPPLASGDPAAFAAFLDRANLLSLPLDLSTALRLRDLPRHHDDPFDRLLIAQALEMDLTVVTHDQAFAAYEGLKVLWT